MSADPRYPPPPDLASLEALLASPKGEERLRGAMGSFHMDAPGVRELLVRRLGGEGNAIVRATLVKAVGRFRERDDIALLGGFLTDPDDRVRANTVEALGFYRDPAVVPFVNRMVADPSGRVRGNAILVLGQYDRKKTLAALSRMAASPTRWKRETAAYVLGRIGGKLGVGGLAQMFRAEPEPDLKRSLYQQINQLAKRRDPAANQVLAALAREEQARAAAAPSAPPDAVSLKAHELEDDGAWADPSKPPPSSSPVRFPEDLESPEARRRIEAVQLAADGDPATFDLLAAALERETDEYVVATLVKKLPRVDGPRSYPLVRRYLEHGDARVRANTVEGLEAAGVPEALEDIRRLLDDPHPRVRAQAARVLASDGAAKGRPVAVLKAMLLEGDEDGAMAAVHALEKIDGAVILEILELALVSPRPRIRERVLFALQVMGERNPVARRVAERYSSGERIQAADEESHLLVRMNSRDEETRYEAIRRLRLIQSEQARSRIELAVNDTSDRIRNLARALVEDFGKAYKRQGILHALGLRALEAIREGDLELPQAKPDIARLEEVGAEIDEAASGEVSDEVLEVGELLARRREALVGLGETVERVAPGCEVDGVRELLGQLREIAPAPASNPPPPEVVPEDITGTAAALEDALRAVEDAPALPGDAAGPPPPDGGPTPGGGPGWKISPAGAAAAAMVVCLVGGVFLAGEGTPASGGGHMVAKPWAVPAEGPRQVAVDGWWAYGAGDDGDLFCVAVRTGAVKWRKNVGALRAETLVAGADRVVVGTADGHLLLLDGPKGQELWKIPSPGELLRGGLVDGDTLLLPFREGGDEWILRALGVEGGARRYERRFTTGAPGALTLAGRSLYLVSGATLFHLDARTGAERWSFDHEEDFLGSGTLLPGKEGAVMAAGASRVVVVSGKGTLDSKSSGLDPGPLGHPLDAGEGVAAVPTEEGLVLLNEVLEEGSRVLLPGPPAQVARHGADVYWTDGTARVGRFRLAAGAGLPAGTSRTAGPVERLVLSGPNPLVGTVSGVELLPPGNF